MPVRDDGLLTDIRLWDAASGVVIEQACLAWKDGLVRHAGTAAAYHGAAAVRYRGAGALVTPGLVDCHTHLVFAGERSGEFAARLAGASYADIARAGGGILSTVSATRGASEDVLFEVSVGRARDLVADGATTVEIKSGYGLDLETERRMLRVARRIGDVLGITVRTTYLGLHALPPECRDDRAAYVEASCTWLRMLAAEGLVDAVDAFAERIAFSVDEVGRLFRVAQDLGLPVKLHADQLSNSAGAGMAADRGALSADHLEWTDEAAVAAMARAGTVAVLLPGSFLVLRETRQPPIAAFRRHGVPMAVATDLNPGTSPLRSLPLAMHLACSLFGLTPGEALAGATLHAARALGLAGSKGVLQPGSAADFVLWDCERPDALSYWLGGRPAASGFAAGMLVAGRLPPDNA